MESLILLSYLSGCSICLLKAVKDFKKNVPLHQTNKLRIYIHTLFFSMVVFVVYAGLVSILVGIDPSFEAPYITIAETKTSFKNYRILAPIIIAILYFGATQASITIAGKEIRIYEKVLPVFIGFLAIPINHDEIIEK